MPTRPRLRSKDGKLNQISDRLKTRINELDLTHDQVAARIASATLAHWNPSRLEVVKMASGLRAITTVELAVIAVALETTACWLMGEEVH